MYDAEIVTQVEFQNGFLAVVTHDGVSPSSAYGLEFAQGSLRESRAGLSAREAFIGFGLMLNQLHEKCVRLA